MYQCLLPCYQLSPPENKTFIFQLWLYILKAFSCVFVPFTLEIVLLYLLDLGCYFGEVISIFNRNLKSGLHNESNMYKNVLSNPLVTALIM